MQPLFKILVLFLLAEIVTAQDTIPAIPSDLYVKDQVSQFPIFMDGDFDIADFDNDGDQDIIILGSRQSSWTEYHPEGTLKRIELYKNSAGVYTKIPLDLIEVHNLGDRMHPECIKWIDFNNDGLADLIYSAEDSLYNAITYVYENSSSGFILRDDIIFNVGRASIYPYDFNNDGYPELVKHSQRDAQTSSSIYFFKNSNGTFIQDTVFAAPSGILKLVDLNQDGNMDFISVRQDTLIYFEIRT